jgi:hypothetical protein
MWGIQPNGQLVTLHFLNLMWPRGAKFSSLPVSFISCAERVDNLEPIASRRRPGLLIPSVYNSSYALRVHRIGK